MRKSETSQEQTVINYIINGNGAQYEFIVRKYNAHLYKIGRSYNFNHDDTLDLIQETFIQAYSHLRDFKGRSSFQTWLIRIMLNNCYKKKEKASYKHEIASQVHDNDTPMLIQSNPDPSKIYHNRELGKIIEDALSQVPHEYRMVFALREINGLSSAETAHLLELSESNVKTKLNRAKKMLQSIIEQSYFHPSYLSFTIFIVTTWLREY